LDRGRHVLGRRTSYAMPDILDIANWNNVADTKDVNAPANLWADRGRVDQYTGGQSESYGSVQINIDHDYLDVLARPLPLAKRWPGEDGPTCVGGTPTVICRTPPASASPISPG
jgi:hypothetical protein